MSVASAILAHKFLVAVALASITTSGGVIAVSGLNTLGTMSFAVNSAISVTSLAKLDFGTLNPGQTATATSMATVNVATSGNYTLSLMSRELLHEVFSSFNVTVTGLGSSPITLNLTHQAERVSLQAGTYNLSIDVKLTVTSDIDHTITVTNVPFLGLGNFNQCDNDNGDLNQGDHDDLNQCDNDNGDLDDE